MGIEQGELLAAVNPVLGVVNIEQNAARYLVKAVTEQIDHRRHHAFDGLASEKWRVPNEV